MTSKEQPRRDPHVDRSCAGILSRACDCDRRSRQVSCHGARGSGACEAGRTRAGVAAGVDVLRQKHGNSFVKVFRSIAGDNGSQFSGLEDAFKERAASTSLIRIPLVNEKPMRSKIRW